MQLCLIFIGGYRVMNGEISLGTLVAVLSLSLLLLGAVNALGTQLNSVSQTATAAVRIFELLDEPLTIQSPTPLARSGGRPAHAHSAQGGRMAGRN